MKQPTAPSLYPELPVEDGQNYRLQKISEIEQTLIKERDNRQFVWSFMARQHQRSYWAHITIMHHSHVNRIKNSNNVKRYKNTTIKS